MGKRETRVNFINVLQAAFMSEGPKSAKKKSFWRFWDLRTQKLLVER